LSNKLKKLKKHLIYNKIQENLNKFHRIKAFINLKEKVQEKKLNREYLIELMKERVNKIEINYSFGIENNLLPSKITYNEIKIELLNKLKDQILKNNNDKPINQNYHLKISFFTEKIIFTKSKLFEDFFNIDNKNITFNETANCFNIKDLNNELIIDNTGTKINISILFSFVFIYPFKNIIEILTIPGLFNFSYGIIMLDFSNNYMINILLEVFQRKEMRKKKLLVFSILDGLSFTYTQDNIKIIKDLLKLGHEKDKSVYELFLPDFNGAIQSDKIKFINNYEICSIFKDIVEIKSMPILEKLNLELAFCKIIELNLMYKEKDKIKSDQVRDLKMIKNQYWRKFFINVS